MISIKFTKQENNNTYILLVANHVENTNIFTGKYTFNPLKKTQNNFLKEIHEKMNFVFTIARL